MKTKPNKNICVSRIMGRVILLNLLPFLWANAIRVKNKEEYIISWIIPQKLINNMNPRTGYATEILLFLVKQFREAEIKVNASINNPIIPFSILVSIKSL